MKIALLTLKRTFTNCVYKNNKIMHEANFGYVPSISIRFPQDHKFKNISLTVVIYTTYIKGRSQENNKQLLLKIKTYSYNNHSNVKYMKSNVT